EHAVHPNGIDAVTVDNDSRVSSDTRRHQPVTPHGQETSSESLLTDEIKQHIRNTIHNEFASVLNDISYRIGVLTDLADRLSGKGNGRVTAQDLNLAVHLIEGYTFTNNSPNAGSVAWSDVHIQYQGTTYTVQ